MLKHIETANKSVIVDQHNPKKIMYNSKKK